MMNTLEEVAQLVRHCTDCPLHQERTNSVPGEGADDADVMFIGEGPGFQEDRLGRPFVGPAGQFLDELLASIGMGREQVFIANMIKCRAPQNRDPLTAEMAACGKYLDRQIHLVNPRLIVPLGRIALGRFFQGQSITQARGKVREKDGQFIYPVMHPAAALHRQENRATIISDFQAIPSVLEDLANAAPVEEPATRTQTLQPQQLTLFQ